MTAGASGGEGEEQAIISLKTQNLYFKTLSESMIPHILRHF